MAPKSQFQRKRVTAQELAEEFAQNNWEERLASCQRVEHWDQPSPTTCGHPLGTRTVGYTYHENGDQVAMVFQYVRPDGTVKGRHPVQLLIGQVYHYF